MLASFSPTLSKNDMPIASNPRDPCECCLMVNGNYVSYQHLSSSSTCMSSWWSQSSQFVGFLLLVSPFLSFLNSLFMFFNSSSDRKDSRFFSLMYACEIFLLLLLLFPLLIGVEMFMYNHLTLSFLLAKKSLCCCCCLLLLLHSPQAEALLW